MKKFALLFLISVFMFAFASCSGNKTEETTAGEEATEETTETVPSDENQTSDSVA